jgi:putative salt-induced outer membrane protein YdiY
MRKQVNRKLCCPVVIVVVAFILCAPSVQAKRNDDVVILKNGDRITGEIKGLQRGELNFKASYMVDAVSLDWARVARLESKDMYQIVLTDGQLFTDYLLLAPASPNTANNFVIGGKNNSIRVKQMGVLRITPVEAKFWQQLQGSIDFGQSYTSGDHQYQVQFSATATYRKEDHTLTASLDSVFSGQSKGSRTARNEFTLNYRKQLSPKWYFGGLFDLLRSDQQSLDLRTTIGGLIGRSLMQTERTRLALFGGVAGTREKYSADLGTPRATNADALAGLDFNTFRFKTTDISSRFLLYPSLTTPGRTRMQFKTDLRVKIVKDLYWGLHLYENYDSKPPVKADKNDLEVSTSLGWTF